MPELVEGNPVEPIIENSEVATPETEVPSKDLSEMSDAEFEQSYKEVVEKKPKPEIPAEKQKTELSVEEKYQRQLQEKEQFIQRQGNEIGSLRKAKQMLDTFHGDPEQAQKYFDEMKRQQTAPEDEYDKDELAALAFEDPVEHHRRVKEIVDRKEQKVRQQQEEYKREKGKQLEALAPDIVENSEEIYRMLHEEDGMPLQEIENLVKNLPNAHIGGLVLLNQRAKLNKENRSLKSENESLRKQLKSRGIEVIDSIANAQKIKASGAAPGQANVSVVESSKPLHSKSQAEIDAFLKASGCLT